MHNSIVFCLNLPNKERANAKVCAQYANFLSVHRITLVNKDEYKEFSIKNWALLCKITIYTLIFKRSFRSDLKQSFSKWQQDQKLLLTGKLFVTDSNMTH